jgi:D-alanine-D-alanine ligase-like ATP-grasp enzyme
MLVQNDKIHVLETNTLPGFTSASLAPKSFCALGGTYSELLDILINTALKGAKK